MNRINLELKFLLLISFILMVALSVNDYWSIEILVKYICTSCIGI
jgi:hypothetical protein